MAFHFNRLPFKCRSITELAAEWSEWIGLVFYDLLPEHGFEIRDEQIYTAFQMATALQHNKVHLAEAGLGTGKTFAYLLNGLIQARLTGRPVIISCASTVLQEQLAGAQGDIATLARLLEIEIDARLAKGPEQYVCDTKVERLTGFPSAKRGQLGKVLEWVAKTESGDRAEIPQVPDRVWSQVAWDESLDCDSCASRGFCRKTKAHNLYRTARDFVVCNHEYYFADLWTRQDRAAEGRRPLLPDYSAVVFDEGHQVFLPAARAAGQKLIKDDLDTMLYRLEKLPAARASLLSAVVAVESGMEQFYQTLAASTVKDERAERLTVRISEPLKQDARTTQRALLALSHELETESSIFSEALPQTLARLYDQRIEQFLHGLHLFSDAGSKTIAWIEREDDSLWVVPQSLGELFGDHLFGRNIPVIFSSATLSNGGDFSYISSTLGLAESKPTRLQTSSISSPFDPETQVLVYVPENDALAELVSLLKIAQGRALVLTGDIRDVKKIRIALKEKEAAFAFEFLWEDLAERGHLLQSFKNEVSSVLVGSSFWEGIDVPGESLSLVVVWGLPFPPSDPILDSLRREAEENGTDPALAVDYPEMALRLKQGCGRLIRARDDRGVIAVLDQFYQTPWEKYVLPSLPEGAPLTRKIQDVEAFFS